MICVEGLSRLINNAKVNGNIRGCSIINSAPAITHLLFADDSFLFFRADLVEAQVIKNLLNDYEYQSGQAVNFNKSGIFFSANVIRDKQKEISEVLGVQTI